MALTLTRDQITEFTHHLHIIPVSKGLTREWLAQNAPDWTTNGLLDALKAAGAVEPSDSHHSGWAASVDSVTVERPHVND